MNKKLLTGVGTIIAVLIIGSVCVGWTSQLEKDTVTRIGYLNIVASLPLFIAEEKGFFQDEGVKYETTAIATSNQLVDAVMANNIDCYIESSAVPVLSVELQAPGRLKIFSVSEITPSAPFDALLVKEGSPIKTISDLSGKKIGVFPGSTATNLLKKYLSDKNIDVSSITFVPMPPTNHLTGLIEGSIDAIHAYEPTIAIAMSKGGVRKIMGSVYAEMISPNPQGVAVVRSSFLSDHPETSHKVISALEKAMIFMKQHDSESRQILAKRMNLDAETTKRVFFLYMVPHNKITTSVFQQYADMLTDLKEINGKVKIDNLLYKK